MASELDNQLFEDRYVSVMGANRFRQITGRDPYDPDQDRRAALAQAKMQLQERGIRLQEMEFAKELAQDAVEHRERERMIGEAMQATDALSRINARSGEFPAQLAEAMKDFPFGIQDKRVQAYLDVRQKEYDSWLSTSTRAASTRAELGVRDEFQQANRQAETNRAREFGMEYAPELAANESTRSVSRDGVTRTFTNPQARTAESGQPTRTERLKAVSDELKAEFGVTYADIRQRGHRGDFKDGEFVPSNDGSIVQISVPGKKDAGESFATIPIERALEMEQRVEGQRTASEPKSIPGIDLEATPKPITQDIAKSFLDQADGDKGKARKLAVAAGYAL